jgi:predicted dehydrogenase
MTGRLNRRHFLLSSAAGALGVGLLRAADKKPSALETLHVGVIGVAGQGGGDMNRIADAGAEIVALCDVDERRTGPARKRFPRAPFYPDFRKLLDQKGIDAILVGTPDHTHAVATVAALKSGRHVFCEKPLTHTVHEARVVAAEAKKAGKVTQMGTQIHASSNYRRVVELIQTGAIGTVREVHTWCNKSWGGGNRPTETPPVPKGLHYDLWLGPAKYRPYHPTYLPFNWRRWWDFGGGTLADMACHHMDLPFWALKLRHPTHVAAEGPPVNPETAAKKLIVHYDFPARGELPPVKLTWYDGGNRPSQFEQEGFPRWGDGNLFVGDKGMLLADYGKHKLLPEEKYKGFTPPKPFIKDSIGHYKEWVEACKTGGPTTCHFGYATMLTQTVLLGNVSYRLGKPFDWDAQKGKASESGAEDFLHREYRKGWSL